MMIHRPLTLLCCLTILFATNLLAQTTPTVTSAIPDKGSTLGGDQVEIVGSGFTGATSVTFGLATTTNFTVVSDTQISVTTPVNSQGTKPVVVTVGQISSSPVSVYTYFPPQEISVSYNSYNIVTGTAMSIGQMPISGASNVTYRIENIGGLDLMIGTVALSGATNCTVNITSFPGSSISPAANSPIVISVEPGAVGAFSFNVTIPNDDANESPFTFMVNGTGSSSAAISPVAGGSGGGGGCASGGAAALPLAMLPVLLAWGLRRVSRRRA